MLFRLVNFSRHTMLTLGPTAAPGNNNNIFATAVFISIQQFLFNMDVSTIQTNSNTTVHNEHKAFFRF